MTRPLDPLPDLVALAAQLDHDERQPMADLVERDQRIAAEIPAATAAGAPDRLLGWLSAAEVEPIFATRHAAERGQRMARAALTAVGAIAGLLLALGTFYYDGSQRVNVLVVLGVFVFLQLGLLLLTLLLGIPGAWRRWVPGLEALADLLGVFSPGRVLQWSRGWLPRAARERFERLAARTQRHQTLYAEVSRWWALEASQRFSVALLMAATGCLLALVTFSDLAFGWSTTLDPAPATIHRFAAGMAWPWSWAWAEAAPSLELVERSRYFRFAGAPETAPAPGDVRLFGQWWPFLLMSLLTYGLLPRLVLLGIARRQLRVAGSRALLETPGVPAVLRRLEPVALSLQSEEAPGFVGLGVPEASLAVAAPAATTLVLPRAVLLWSDPLGADAALERLGWPGPVGRLGGEQSPAADRAAIAALASGAWDPAAGSAAPPVAVLVAAWEPPVAECLDCLRELRTALGRGAAVSVLPLGLPGQAVRAGDFRQWQQRLATLADPWLEVIRLPAPEGARDD